MLFTRTLVLNVPVIHKGFLDFIKSNKKKIGKVFIFDQNFVKKLSQMKADPAFLDSSTVIKLLNLFDIENVEVVTENNISEVKNHKLILINDQVSRELARKYLKEADILWENVFLRWDRESVLADKPLNGKVSSDVIDLKMMKEAYKEAEKSSDWWRRVGAVLVKEKKIIFRAYNEALPNDYTPYQVGNVRDYVKAGEKQELSSTIHAEQKIISLAAKEGVSLLGSSLYITHFPCPVCTKLIIFSGIKKCFFVEGASNLEGDKLLRLAGVDLLAVKLK